MQPCSATNPSVIQGVDHFKDIQYNSQSRYGDIFLQQEFEMSCFNLDHADIESHRQMYALYEKVRISFCRWRKSLEALVHQAGCLRRRQAGYWSRSCPSPPTSSC